MSDEDRPSISFTAAAQNLEVIKQLLDIGSPQNRTVLVEYATQALYVPAEDVEKLLDRAINRVAADMARQDSIEPEVPLLDAIKIAMQKQVAASRARGTAGAKSGDRSNQR